jgi:phosphoglycolate phosphatase
MNTLCHVIWDYNGTIVDDTALCLEILNEQLQSYQLAPLTLADYRDRFGFPVQHFYTTVGFDWTRHDFEAINRAFITAYNQRRHHCQLHPDIVPCIDLLASRGVRHSILSAYAAPFLQEVVTSHAIQERFEHIVGLDSMLSDSKIEQGRRLLARLALAQGTVVLVGDTLHDQEVARELGIRAILIDRGHQSPQRLRSAHAEVVNSAAQLLHCLGMDE